MDVITWLWIVAFALAGVILLVFIIVRTTAKEPPCICSHAVVWPLLIVLCVAGGLLVYGDKMRSNLPSGIGDVVKSINDLAPSSS